jgi:hypothetical protein
MTFAGRSMRRLREDQPGEGIFVAKFQPSPSPLLNPPLLGVGSDDPTTPAAGVTGIGGTKPGVLGSGTNSTGVLGIGHKEPGVSGISDSSDGVRATSTSGNGLSARSMSSVAIFAESTNGTGVLGIGQKEPGVSGVSDSGDGVRATSTSGNGLSARSTDSVAIFAESTNSTGILGIGHAEPGVRGASDSSDGVRATSSTGNGLSAFGGGDSGVGIFAQASAKRSPATGTNPIAGFFDGDVVVAGDIRLSGGDCAENFDVSAIEMIVPGTVMVINDEGGLRPSDQPYDKKVAGVISGAGDYRPGLVLDDRPSEECRMPIALMGKVYCKVDARFGAVEVGDLLTTSSTPGHAMKAGDPLKAFGSVIGKALRAIAEGRGLIPILVALQ